MGQAYTVDCPDVGTALTSVPEQAKEDVDKELALLDQQIAEAYQRLKETSAAQQQDPGFVDNAILGPLKDKRAATIARILQAIDRVGDPRRDSRASPGARRSAPPAPRRVRKTSRVRRGRRTRKAARSRPRVTAAREAREARATRVPDRPARGRAETAPSWGTSPTS